jgi:hypothetical protein
VLATGDPILRSRNSAPYLNRDEYDFEEVYADMELLMADDIKGCVEVKRDIKGSA